MSFKDVYFNNSFQLVDQNEITFLEAVFQRLSINKLTVVDSSLLSDKKLK